MLHAVILAGGSGTRLWPLSRTGYPKQFLTLLGTHTLLQQTVLRLGESVRLGIVPARPETGYGYIRRGAPFAAPQAALLQDGQEAYHVERFVEKPDLPTAQHYLASGTYYWNAGIFLWQASTILEEIA